MQAKLGARSADAKVLFFLMRCCHSSLYQARFRHWFWNSWLCVHPHIWDGQLSHHANCWLTNKGSIHRQDLIILHSLSTGAVTVCRHGIECRLPGSVSFVVHVLGYRFLQMCSFWLHRAIISRDSRFRCGLLTYYGSSLSLGMDQSWLRVGFYLAGRVSPGEQTTVKLKWGKLHKQIYLWYEGNRYDIKLPLSGRSLAISVYGSSVLREGHGASENNLLSAAAVFWPFDPGWFQFAVAAGIIGNNAGRWAVSWWGTKVS